MYISTLLMLLLLIRNCNLLIHTHGLRMRAHRYKNVNKDHLRFIFALLLGENKILFLRRYRSGECNLRKTADILTGIFHSDFHPAAACFACKRCCNTWLNLESRSLSLAVCCNANILNQWMMLPCGPRQEQRGGATLGRRS